MTVHVDWTQVDPPRTWRLLLERESATYWIVSDVLTDEMMIRTPSCDTAVAFIRAFVAKEANASIVHPAVTEHSWRVAQDATSHDRLATVYRLRPHEPLDETA